ncbi:hypothetical protein BN871_GR_00250 [Paenibacillus sp. P22]|nr:hypothetical protein BN871_GR_00250 [Paenibacillus sp. P22]
MPAFRLLKDVAHCFVDMCIADNSLLDKRCAENGDIFFHSSLVDNVDNEDNFFGAPFLFHCRSRDPSAMRRLN